MSRAARIPLRFAALLLLAALGACAPKNYVVLLDNDTPSAVVVTNQGGSTTLDRPGTAVRIPSATRAPETVALSQPEIDRQWAEAIAAQPPRPVHFLLYFVLDTPKLTPASRSELPKVLELIKQRPAPEVAIVGHTDRSGPTDYNYQLGLQRAQAVRREVEAIGVPSALITVTSHGANNPLVQTRQPYEPRNRRVEITVR